MKLILLKIANNCIHHINKTYHYFKVKLVSRLKYRQVIRQTKTEVVTYFSESTDRFTKTFISTNIKQLTGYEKSECLNNQYFWLDNIHPSDQAASSINLRNKNDKQILKYRLRKKSGEYIWVQEEVSFFTQNNQIKIIGTIIPISVHAQEKTLHSMIEPDLIEIIEFSTNAMALNDISNDPKILHLNHHFTKLFGYDIDDIPTVKAWAEAAYPEKKYRHQVFKEWFSSLNMTFNTNEKNHSQEVIITCKDQSKKYVIIAANVIRNYVLITFIDITDIRLLQNQTEIQKQNLEARFNYLNNFDALTNLPNHQSAIQNLNTFIKHIKSSKDEFGCIFLLDLDEFKNINEIHGNKAGDLILKEAVKIINEIPKQNTQIYRLYKDEFLIIAKKLPLKKAIEYAIQIQKSLAQGVEINQSQKISLSACISILEISYQSNFNHDLITNLYSLMTKAKAHGKSSIEYLIDIEQSDLVKDYNLLQDLKKAIINNEFKLLYQPQIDINSSKIIGAEALIRWMHPTLGVISPDDFIPLAEQNNLINAIGRFVFQEACSQAKEWLKRDITLSSISINLSPLQFKDRYFKKFVTDTLNKMELDPSLVDLELTESALIYDDEAIFKTIENLRLKGLKLSVDDFGTGYSSMSYLRMFAIDRIKIDRSFVSKMLERKEDYAIVQSIIELANRLNIETIAEGVENINTLKALKDLGCCSFQGYLISKPIDPVKFAEFYSDYHKKPLKI